LKPSLTVGLLHAAQSPPKNFQLIRSLLKTFGKLWSTEGLTALIAANVALEVWLSSGLSGFMAIEITSIPDERFFSRRMVAGSGFHFFRAKRVGDRRLILKTFAGLIVLALAIGGDALVSSYKYYARIIDARLASGYLTSRPGLYAAPRTLRAGQRLSRPDLIAALRRAGYVKSDSSNVWSGSFRETDDGFEIRPTANQTRSGLITITLAADNQIAELHEDGLPVNSFALEPEILSQDLSTKAGKREAVRFAELPPILVHAILSAEDHRFFQHPGFDIVGISRALLRNANDERLGQGASTITQQLVKNTYLSPERTLARKYAEAMLSYALEQRLSKDDIFALYCNEIYLGQQGAVAVRGVQEASRIYFGKELKDLSLNEAATISGMIQGPSRYSPIQHAEAARLRRNIVLQAMTRDGWISAEQETKTAAEPVTVTADTAADRSLAPYFVDYVNRTADAGVDDSAARRVFTTIDLDLQRLAESALHHQLDRLTTKGSAKPQAALVALDPHNGNVLAMVGGRDYAASQLNRATDARRQPGSTFKPFVYAAALEDGMSPVQTFSDTPREFVYDRDKTYHPANYGGGYSMRDVTMRTALVKSLNVVTVDVALQTGLARIANLSEKFGLPKPERYPSLALGTKEVTPLELAAAYAAFVNGGHRVQPRAILSVGEPPATHSATNIDSDPQVITPTTAYMMTNMLSAVIDHGTARTARELVKGVAVAGKTGTSRDGWFVGYTPNLVCVVWIGFDDNQQLGLTGAEAALPAWAEFINAAVEMKPELGGRNFVCPEGIKFVEIDPDNGSLATLSCPRRELIAVTDRLAPNVECLLHGQLPDSIGVGSAEVAGSISQPSVAQPLTLQTNTSASALRVDIDRRGKRTLINALR
jgi:penicillin-binding protein 1B